MQQRYTPKLGNKLFRPSRVKPWQVSLPKIPAPKAGGISSLTIIYGFAGLIALGTILLMLPISSKTGQYTPLVNALFTATSAVCVTGLVVVDTGTYWSYFGQVVIFLLFQIGGLGFMTSATLFLLILGRRIGLQERLLIRESMGLERLGGLVKIVRRVALFTLIIEGAGAVFLFFSFLSNNSPLMALWKAVFHSVSAFNNAGFDLFGNFRSLSDYLADGTVLLIIGVIVIFGSISYLVVEDVLKTRSFSRLSLDSKMVITTTFTLLLFGTIFILITEFSNPATIGTLSFPHKLVVAFFQSVTPKTAGFSVIDMSKIAASTLFLTIFLMFIGGASGSTAGGVKVGTISLLVGTALSSIKGREHPEAFGRELDVQNIHRALALVIIYLAFASLIVVALSITETSNFDSLLFETFSALGTVGLTTGITPGLSPSGKIIIIIAMFVGRLGPLTLILALARRQQPAIYRFPQDTIRIG